MRSSARAKGRGGVQLLGLSGRMQLVGWRSTATALHQQRTDPCTVPGAPQPSVRAHQGTAMSTKSTQGHSRLLAMFARCLFSSCKVRAHRSGAPCILWGLQRGTRAALGVQGEH